MATSTLFDNMLRSYAPNKLFREELVKRDWFLSNVEKDESWLGDALEVRFKAATASSVKFGSLTTQSDIASSQFTKGTVTNQPEAWGSLIFWHKDLMRHGKLSEQNFLKVLPGEVEDFTSYMKMGLSLGFTNGHVFATAVAGGTPASGILKVDRVERFELGQKVQVKDSNTPAAAYYVTAINMNTDEVTLSATRGGAAADLTAAGLAIADTIEFMMDGQETAANRLTSLKKSLLSAANGGDANLYGVSKLAAPYTQALNIDGSTITSSNLLTKLFDAQTETRRKGKGNPSKCVMSLKHLGTVLKLLEASKGAYRQADDLKASLYGWTEVSIVGVRGRLDIVAIDELDDDWMAFLDMGALKVYSNGGVQKRVSPDGKEYFEVRDTTNGFAYIVDIAFMGDMILERPSRCSIVYGISY
jgi:hypothetical protein